MLSKTVIVIVGPTAIGKTAVSINIAKKLHCPILSADSRQFFKEMSIGTAKPSAEEMQGVTHYFINSHSITDDYNVGKYEAESIALLEELFKEHDQVIVVGGSGLYIDALCKGFDELPEANTEVREKIQSVLMSEGIEGLQHLLQKHDPEYYNKVDLNNPQRLSRAIEVYLTTGIPYSQFRKGENKKRNFNTIKIGLNDDRERLYERINKRVDDMINKGLIDEVRSLVPYKHLNALQTVGYKELFDHFENKTDLPTAIELIKQNTRRFAKRQLTWFRRDEEITWFAPNEQETIFKFITNRIAN
jgi:tRNA dimethylallyltransferase